MLLPPNTTIIDNGNADHSISLYDKNIEKEVGMAGLVENCLFFIIYRKDYTTLLTGKQIFAALFDAFLEKGVPFEGIKGNWGKDSTNTAMFNKALQEGYTETEAALKTWTGQRAEERSYNQVKINSLEPKENPPYTKIKVTFYPNTNTHFDYEK